MRGKDEEGTFQRERDAMVEEQLARRGIEDRRVLQAFRQVAREEFVPEGCRGSAYEDHPLDIGSGQTISQPYMVALMTQTLALTGKEEVLEIGTGSGYQTAILAVLARRVYTIERIAALSAAARERLERLGCANVEYHVGDGTLGWPEQRTFERIMVTAAAPSVPEPLATQLAEGGLLVIPVGGPWEQMLYVVEKRGHKLSQRNVCGCVFVKLIGEHGWKIDDVDSDDP